MQEQAGQSGQNLIIKYLRTLNHIKQKSKGDLQCLKKYLHSLFS